jgi:hypothetical protein
MKIEKETEILFYFWLPTGTYHKNLAIWKQFFCNLAKSELRQILIILVYSLP